MGNGNIKKSEGLANVSEKVLEKLKQKLGKKENENAREEKIPEEKKEKEKTHREKTNSANKEEKTLEEEIEEENFEEFETNPNFIPAPRIIESQPAKEAPLEQVAMTAPPVAEEEKKDDAVKYGVASATYTSGGGEYAASKYANYEAAPAIREMERRGLMIQQHEVGQVRPRTEIRDWHELQETQTTRDRDAVMEATPLDKETHLPFEEKRKYRNKPVF